MPRQKKPMPDPQVTPVDTAVLTQITGIPPLTHKGATPDQQMLWRELRTASRFVSEMLKAFYTGQAPPVWDHLTPQQRRIYHALTRYYLDFYQMIWWCWEAIERHASRHERMPRTPGEALLLLFKQEFTGYLAPAYQPYDRYSISGHREVVKLRRDIEKLKAQGKKTALLEKKLAQHQRWDTYLAQYNRFLTDCMICVESIGRPTKEQRQAIKRFCQSHADKLAAIESMLHPRHRAKGFEWRHGAIVERE